MWATNEAELPFHMCYQSHHDHSSPHTLTTHPTLTLIPHTPHSLTSHTRPPSPHTSHPHPTQGPTHNVACKVSGVVLKVIRHPLPLDQAVEGRQALQPMGVQLPSSQDCLVHNEVGAWRKRNAAGKGGRSHSEGRWSLKGEAHISHSKDSSQRPIDP